MVLSHKKYIHSQSGFTYIEALLAIMLTLIAAGSISFGIAKGVRAYKSMVIKEKAVQALIDYTNEYRMMVAYGEKPHSGVQPRWGHNIVLYHPKDEFEGFSFGRKEGLVEGKLYHMITNKTSETAGEQSGYYNIKTWIKWNEQNAFDYSGWKHIAFDFDQPVLVK